MRMCVYLCCVSSMYVYVNVCMCACICVRVYIVHRGVPCHLRVPTILQLRLLYECNPMAFIIEQAGGKATDGKKAILDIQPTAIHQRAPIFIGSKDNVDDYLRIREEYEQKKIAAAVQK